MPRVPLRELAQLPPGAIELPPASSHVQDGAQWRTTSRLTHADRPRFSGSAFLSGLFYGLLIGFTIGVALAGRA